MRKFIAILAGSYREFDNYTRTLPEVWREKARFINSVDATRGVRFDDMIVIGTFWDAYENAGEIFKYVTYNLSQEALEKRYAKSKGSAH